MKRIIRYQAVIIRDDRILLVKLHNYERNRDYWILPGGGREDNETEEDCVIREVKEETGLEVDIARLLMDKPAFPGGVYQRYKTYLCSHITGEAYPGIEPEFKPGEGWAITDIRWLDLKDESTWEAKIVDDPSTYPQLKQIQTDLGYIKSPVPEGPALI